ncbi:MAG: hypothetical protein JNG89_10160 [Planctomycetaceae bacterium]|nr:hypothetical protein [Planctomycetaceae bacterium]
MSQFCSGEDGVSRIGVESDISFAESVTVQGRELVFTSQLLPLDARGALVGPEAPREQIERVLDSLFSVLEQQQCRPEDVVRLNIYVADERLSSLLCERWKLRVPGLGPSLSMVTTRLPVAGAMLAVDAVAARAPTITDALPVRARTAGIAGHEHIAHAAVLPVGETIYISGQAEPGANLVEATANTLAGLQRTLEHLGLGKQHVVEVKCFLTPMSEAESVYNEVSRFFGDGIAPPVSVVDWISTLPIEIEMVVHAPAGIAKPGATHEWLPWLTNSPVYCRLARVQGDTQIFVSGCFGSPGDNETLQVAEVFDRLQERLKEAGSDLRHMVKATYYVSNDAASAAVNEIRPTLYDPEHPPAASKALVTGVGQLGGAVTLDMIAIPAR